MRLERRETAIDMSPRRKKARPFPLYYRHKWLKDQPWQISIWSRYETEDGRRQAMEFQNGKEERSWKRSHPSGAVFDHVELWRWATSREELE